MFLEKLCMYKAPRMTEFHLNACMFLEKLCMYKAPRMTEFHLNTARRDRTLRCAFTPDAANSIFPCGAKDRPAPQASLEPVKQR